MTRLYLVQHGQKVTEPGDPGLTAFGRRQARETARWLADLGVTAVHSSRARRARETAAAIAAATGLKLRLDDRLRERMNWDGAAPYERLQDFLDDWALTVRDRAALPRRGDSSQQAARRLLAFLREHADAPGPVAAVTHGGVTVDLLRHLLGDEALPAGLLTDGVLPCAITTLDGTAVRTIASTSHLTAS